MKRLIIEAAVVAFELAACFPADKKIEAAAGYEAQQMRCVEKFSTKAEIDHCRMEVKLAWSATDAGGDADAEGGK